MALAEDSSSAAVPEAGENTYYFAIGAMMNPHSMKNRRINPICSFPAEIFDFELRFSGVLGFADAVPSEGASFHGVLHLVDPSTMTRLDELELAYKRVEAQARLYDNTIVTATVYTKESFTSNQIDNPPQQRYLELLIEGAKHFQVDEKQMEFLENHECVPRPMPSEFKSFAAAIDLPLLSYDEDVSLFNGRDTPNLRLAINGKVLEIFVKNVESSNLFKNGLNIYKQFGQRVELVLSRIMYDPKYGCPLSVEDCTREHSAYIEHILHSISEVNESIQFWNVIGRIQQDYKDSEN